MTKENKERKLLKAEVDGFRSALRLEAFKISGATSSIEKRYNDLVGRITEEFGDEYGKFEIDSSAMTTGDTNELLVLVEVLAYRLQVEEPKKVSVPLTW